MAEFLALADAVAAHVRDGDMVAMEGFTHLIPFAAGHEVIRQKRKRLTLVRMTPDLIYDQLIGMHRGLTDAQSAHANARLILLLANHIGDAEVLDEAMRPARGAAGTPAPPTSGETDARGAR